MHLTSTQGIEQQQYRKQSKMITKTHEIEYLPLLLQRHINM